MNSRKLLVAVTVLGAVTVFFFLDLHRYFTLAALKAHHAELLAYYHAHRFTVLAGFVVLYIVQTALSLPGAAILSLAAGALFGTMAGTICVVTAATIGATLAFMGARYLLRDLVMRLFGSRLERLNSELEQRGLNYLLFLRLVPLFPFFLINLAAGLTRLPLPIFFIGTLAGIIPGAFVFINAGASLATIDSLAGIVSPRVVGAFALLGLFALLPALYSKFRNRG